MGRYVILHGQNVYDVALYLYGSIEGVEDLMMNNRDLSLSADLEAGKEMFYTDGFVINADVAAHNRQYNIIPSNGEHGVYPKYFTLPLCVTFQLVPTITMAGFYASGTGKIEIDWGDNSPVESVEPGLNNRFFSHVFNNQVEGKRIVRWYSDSEFTFLDWSDICASRICILRPLVIEEFVLKNSALLIDFFHLVSRIYDADLEGMVSNDLSPLIGCLELMHISFANARLKPDTADAYLKQLVADYGLRRNCEVIFSVRPTGDYREPDRDEQGHYLVTSGMEAIWVIVNEEAWNEGGAWKFIIENDVFTIGS